MIFYVSLTNSLGAFLAQKSSLLTIIRLHPAGEMSDQETFPFVVNYYTSGETKCTFQLRNVDDDENYSPFLDLLSEIVDAFITRKTKKFCKFLNPSPDLKKDLQDLNRKRKG